MSNRPIVTIQSHILQQQAQFPEATGDLSWILSAISISAKMIAAQVRRARLEDVLGSAGEHNVQGEQQQKLDVIANDILMRNLGGREGVAVVASEENEEPVILRTENDGEHPLLRDVRSAGWLVEPRHLRLAWARSSASCARTGARRRSRIRCCSPAVARLRPAT